jgi:hypothetical protein
VIRYVDDTARGVKLFVSQKKSGSLAKTFAHSSSDLVAKISSSSAMSSTALAARTCAVSKRGSVNQSDRPTARHSAGQ